MTGSRGDIGAGPLRVLVVEDERVARDYLVELIAASGLATIVGAVGSIDAASAVIGEGALDAAFVDVQLVGSGSDGMALVRSHAGRPAAPRFILATALREHAIEAFELGVVDYVTKPFTRLRVAQCLARVVAMRAAAGAEADVRVAVRKGRSLVFVVADDIWCVESAARLTYVHSAHGVYDIDLSLAAVDAAFPRRFVRVHRNWLVNLSHIRELKRDIGGSVLLVGSGYRPEDPRVAVPVAKDRSQDLRELLLGRSPGVRRR